VITCIFRHKPNYASACDSVTDIDKPQTLKPSKKNTIGLIIFTVCYCRINFD